LLSKWINLETNLNRFLDRISAPLIKTKNKMKSAKLFFYCFSLGMAGINSQAHAQKEWHYDLAGLLKKGLLETTPAQETQILENSLPGAISTKGVVWCRGIRFTEGTIDIDLRGKNVFLQSFLGIAFHGMDTLTYDELYFRPFNFRHPDSLRRKWSVQYMSLPDYSYDRLRKEHPLVYENAVTPGPEPDAWFHAKIVIRDHWISVYVNHSMQASLHVHLLNDRNGGMFGVWDDELSGDFANLRITQ
jgi:hypothetical protein